MKENPVRHLLTQFGVWTAHPGAFFMVLAYGLLWLYFDAKSLGWGAVAVLATWFMTLVIQRAESRHSSEARKIR